MQGKVYLVGAGPGDPGLITVKGLELLRKAEVVVYDHLVDTRLLAEISKDAEVIYVGKSSSHHTMSQKEINRLLIGKAKEGKNVLRLKGGDPFVFGRGGEEAEELVSEGIPFEVVPGVTAAIAVPAYAGIPVTHRKVASSFAVITGHETPEKEQSNIAWARLATGVDTLVFLMGVSNLGYIVQQLVKNGRPANTPVALVREGTLPGQRTVTGTLADIEAKAREAGITPPAIIVVGEVVGLRKQLKWFEGRPLLGLRVLVTRTREQAGRLSQALIEQGADAIELPTIEIEAVKDNPELDRAVHSISNYHWAFFTSVNAVNIFMERLSGIGGGPASFCNARIGAIGPATAEALSRHGLKADYVPQRYIAEGILEGIEPSEVRGKRVLLPRADIARPELVEGLKAMGAEVEQVVVYRTVPAKDQNNDVLRLLREKGVDVITFTSSSTVRNFMGTAGGRLEVQGCTIACIGPVTAATATEMGLAVDVVAQEHTIPGLVKALVDYVQSKRKPALNESGED